MAKKDSSKAFYALDDPLEAAVFLVLVEMINDQKIFISKNHCSMIREPTGRERLVENILPLLEIPIFEDGHKHETGNPCYS